MKKKINVLLAPRHETSWRKLSEIAVFLEKDGRFNAFILLASFKVQKYQNECDDLNIRSINICEDIESRCNTKFNKLDKYFEENDDWLNKIDAIGTLLLISYLRAKTLKKRLLSEYVEYINILKAHSINMVLLPGDRELSPIPALIKAARDSKIPLVNASLSSPYTEGLIEARKKSRRFKTKILTFPPILNLFVRLKYPKQTIMTNEGRLLFSPGWLSICLDRLGMLNPSPWAQGNNSDYLLQHCKNRVIDYKRLGVKSEKIILTGDPSVDLLYESYMKKNNIKIMLGEKYNILLSKPVVIISVPNDAEHGVCEMKEHQKRMDEFLSLFDDYECNVLLSLHPKSNKENYLFLQEKYGYFMVDEKLSTLLPIADLFVCSVSSTILWAKICNVFTINLDYLYIQDADSDGSEIVKTVHNKTEFKHFLDIYFTKEKSISCSELDESDKIKSDYLFDGKSKLRICDFLCQVIDRGRMKDGLLKGI